MFKHSEFITIKNPNTIELSSLREHIVEFQEVQAQEMKRGAQVACQIDFNQRGEHNGLTCTYSLTQPLKILLIASFVFQSCVAATLFVMYLNNFFASTHFLFKAMFILPIFGLLTIMVMKASFDQKVKQLSDSIRAAIKR
ncbi:MAG: hypothetical protein RLZZ211_259 [Bacteroidota bacterium]|jgi:hypothetical protein